MEPAQSLAAKEPDATFATAITKSEFGRFYWDEQRELEVRRSMASALARVKDERRARAKLAKKMSSKTR